MLREKGKGVDSKGVGCQTILLELLKFIQKRNCRVQEILLETAKGGTKMYGRIAKH